MSRLSERQESAPACRGAVPVVHNAELSLSRAKGFSAARDVVEAEARQRNSKGPLRVRERGKHGLFEDAGSGGVIVVAVDGVGCAQNLGNADALAFARELITAARAAHAVEDAGMHQRLQHRLEMACRQVVARGELARRDGTFAPMQRNVDHSRNREQTFARREMTSRGGSYRKGY